MKRFDYYQPESLKEAYKLMEKLKGEARYIAGGTDLIVKMKQKVLTPKALISLRRVEGLAGITKNGGMSLGSMTLFREIERDPDLARIYPCLSRAASVLANPQIRNVATIGGNLCNAAPSADSAPPLMVLGATVVIEGPGGSREIPIEELFQGPGATSLDSVEILTQIKIPEPTPNSGSAFVKIGRLSQDIAIVNAAVMVVMEGRVCKECKAAVGAVASTPLRLEAVEEMVAGNSIEGDLLDAVEAKVKELVSPISDVRASEEYRREVAGVLVRRALIEAANEAE